MEDSETTNNSIQRRQLRQRRIKTWMQLLGYPSGSLGIAGTIYLFSQGQPILAILTVILSIGVISLAIASKFLSDLFNRIQDKIEEKLEQKVDLFANYIVEELENNLVKTWWKLTSKFEHKYYQQLIYDCRDYKTLGLKTKPEFTLDLEKIFVPLRVSPESYNKISGNIIHTHQINQNNKNLTIWHFLVASKTNKPYNHRFRKIAIIGSAGSGKTTLLKDITLTYAQNRYRRQNRQASKLIPVLIYLRDIRDLITVKKEDSQQYSANKNINLPSVIVQQKSIAKLKPREVWFQELLENKPCLVMLDGLDEVANDEQRKAVTKWVNQQIDYYQEAHFFITSRPHGYQIAPIENVTTILDVQPFSLDEMALFINNWYLQREIMSRLGKDDQGVRDEAKDQAEDLINRIKNNPNLTQLALNPLLLTMIATVHCYRGALPGRRVELYAEICDVLLGKRDSARGVTINLTSEQQKVVLQTLALQLMLKNTREFSLELGSELIREKLKDIDENLSATDFIKNIEKRSALIVERENNLYEFAHKSFQEYLTAVEIKESNQEIILTENINNSSWEETIRLYSAQTDATNLIKCALQISNIYCLKLALDCCDEGLIVKPNIKEKVYQKIEQGLESFNQDEFRLAVKVKISRRLNQLLRINENLAIDKEYITCAEYQLFMAEYQPFTDKVSTTEITIECPDNWQNQHFRRGDSQEFVRGISREDADRFCDWLYTNLPEKNLDYYFRLITTEEEQKYPTNDNYVINDSIRIVRITLSFQLHKLVRWLANQQWREADEETTRLILQLGSKSEKSYLTIDECKNFPKEELRTIDQLWLKYSDGKFGFSVQKQIYLEVGGKLDYLNYDSYQRMSERIGWRENGVWEWLNYNDYTFDQTKALQGHLPGVGGCKSMGKKFNRVGDWIVYLFSLL